MKSLTLIAFLFPCCLGAQTFHNWRLTNPGVDFEINQILNDQYYAGRSNYFDYPVLISIDKVTAELQWAKKYQDPEFKHLDNYTYFGIIPNNKIILGFMPDVLPTPIPYSTTTIVSSLNLKGVPEWSKKLTFSHEYNLEGISFDSQGNILLLGWGSETLGGYGKTWLTSMDTLGNVNWIKSYSAGSYNSQITYKIDGFSSGIYTSLVYGLPSGKDVTVISRLNENGNVIWSKTFKDVNGESIHYRSIGEDSNGNIIFVGYGDSFNALYGPYGLVMKMNNAGEVLYSKVIRVSSMPLLYVQLYFMAAFDQNKVLLGGVVAHNAWGNDVAFAIKLDENGHKLNEQVYPHSQNSSVSFPFPYQNALYGIAKTNSNGYTLTGITYGHTTPAEKAECFLIETDNDLVAPCNSEPPPNPFIVEDYPLTVEAVTLTVKEEIHNWVDAVILAKPYVLNDTIICQTTVGTEEVEPAVEHKSVHISPNPVSESLTLLLDSPDWSNEPMSISITDALGREVLYRPLASGSNSELQLDVSSLISGSYYLTASNEEKSETIRFVVQH